jgi:putative PEP-CTERM system TPR-repeat lipoprotein
MMMWKRTLALFGLLAWVGVSVACNRAETARRHLEAGDGYLAEGKYSEAIIEYRNALEADDRLGQARYGLAQALTESGNPERAIQEYVRAADLLPDDDDVQVRAATVLLMTRQFDDVRTRTERVLARSPRNLEAQILYANALAGLRDFESAIAEIDEAIQMDPASAAAQTSLGLLRLAQGQRDAARQAFLKAVELEPQSIQALLALVNFQWSSGELAQAEATLGRALAVDPRHATANRAMAVLYMVTNRVDQAEAHFKVGADVSPNSSGRLALADYYAQLRRFDDAQAVLEPMVSDPRIFADAQTRLSQIHYIRGNIERAQTSLDDVLAKQPGYAPALITKARWLVTDRQFAAALDRARAAVASAPGDIGIRYLFGAIQAANGLTEEAGATFNEVLRRNPRAVPAQVQLSHLRLLSGDPDTAVQLAREAVNNSRGGPEARLALARSLIAARDLPQARLEVATLLQRYPRAAGVHAADGTLRLVSNDAAGARAAYERAYALDPTSLAAITGLTLLDMQEDKADAARIRLETRLAVASNRPALLVLAAKVYIAQRDLTKAEAALRRTIEADASVGEAYGLLVDIYREQQRVDAARTEFDRIAAANPKDVAARTVSALLLHAQNKLADAKQRYTEILALDPRAAVAANNLAWIYADEGENLDAGLQLAQRAVDLVPDRAAFRDTLGWVYLRKQLPQLAVRPFEQAVAREPETAVFHYHLGLAYAGSGERARGRDALQRALELNPALEEAKRELAALQP